MSILRWGWNDYFEAVWREANKGNKVPARVIAQHRGTWQIASDFGECRAQAAGRLRLAGKDGGDWPAVGDWVATEVLDQGRAALIYDVLARRGQFVRKMAGKKVGEQVLAANVDIALLVSALDRDFNLRRIERYMAQCWESCAEPLIVLNKADTCADVPDKVREAEQIAPGALVHAVSAKTGQGFDQLQKYLCPGQTLALLGSSGVGKSTIVNRLMGGAIQQVQEIRESDSRGRHTTTARELFALPSGALLIDTPGLREFQLWDAEDGLARAFADIDALAERCRFNDCCHEAEPGCAVQASIQAGELEGGRLENWRKLLREEEFLRRKIDPEARQTERHRVKKLMREVRKIYRERDKG